MKLLALLLSFIFLQTSYSQTNTLGFLDNLLKEKDYFRAITVLKELRFDAINDSNRVKYEYMIGYSYYKSAKYENAIDYLTLVAEKQNVPLEITSRTRTLLSLSYYGMKMYDYALMELDNISVKDTTYLLSTFYRTLLQIERKQFSNSEHDLGVIIAECKNPDIVEKSKKILDIVKQRHTLPSKSPILAGILSGIVPGLGQIYSQHYFDGAQAMSFVGILGYATYATYQYNHLTNKSHLSTAIIGLIAGMFHASNILGAIKTAEFRNSRINDEYLNEVRSTYLSIDMSISL